MTKERFWYRFLKNHTPLFIKRIIWRFYRPSILQQLPTSVSRMQGIAIVFTELFLITFHGFIRSYLLRKALKKRRLWQTRHIHGSFKIMHVAGSFDLGGSQVQIGHLLENQPDDILHEAIEIFPEINFHFRINEKIKPERYIIGNVWQRSIGYLTLLQGYRSYHVIQIYKLYCDFRALRPDGIIAWGHEMCITAFIAAALAEVNLIFYTIRTPSMPNSMNFYPFLQMAHKQSAGLCNAVIVNRADGLEQYAQWAEATKNKIQYVPNAVKVKKIKSKKSIRKLYNIPQSALLILHAGRFTPEKQHPLMIKAAGLLAKKKFEKPIFWLFCGDGPGLADAKQQAQGLNNVIFAGRIENMNQIYQEGNIFIMPSSFEGTPNALLEAMAHGLACISTQNSGITHMVSPEDLVYLPALSAVTLSECIAGLIGDNGLRRKLSQNAARKMKQYSVKTLQQNFNQVLRNEIK